MVLLATVASHPLALVELSGDPVGSHDPQDQLSGTTLLPQLYGSAEQLAPEPLAMPERSHMEIVDLPLRRIAVGATRGSASDKPSNALPLHREKGSDALGKEMAPLRRAGCVILMLKESLRQLALVCRVPARDMESGDPLRIVFACSDKHLLIP